jgi:glycosyltransferase involved in cell wall biosynthesis
MIKIIRSTTVPQSLNRFCKGVLRELSKKYEVVALSSPGEAMQEIVEREGVRTIDLPMERHISFGKDLKSLFALMRVFQKESPIMVHSMTPKAGMLCMLAAWITRVPVRVHTFTGLVFPTSTGVKRKILMATDWITCACATHIIPEGEGVKNDLLNNGITRKPLKVLGYGNVCGVDMKQYSRRPEVLEIANTIRKEDIFTFVFVGRIVRDKGINELCYAMNKLSEITSVRLLLIGKREDNLDPISDSAEEIIDKNPSIEYLGPKYGDELLAYYAASDCFVFPSYREGFPNTVLEAGAMGLPSIVTDINGSREIIVEGKNGVIIPSHDADSLFEAMLNMLKDKTTREIMAGNARDMIASRYEQGFVRKCLYDFYDEILPTDKN